ncbi:N-terminal nucleophile aminohydrolase [Linderina pennispora]|uniref:N-terminal nucleophile aminohydrolase n=1 Tax=Linderina pennispora TaxID=61395 RepID=A0A1Y1W362_9FUNG|nr:N-terminal nucleophile aminohydrolase [Linderina pennispora]ORX67832.1 N-terminal nucleophile aminohydrolase [Linderina pennispora]
MGQIPTGGSACCTEHTGQLYPDEVSGQHRFDTSPLPTPPSAVPSVDSIRSQFSDRRDTQSKDDSIASSFAWNYRNRPPSRPNPKLGVQTDPSMSSKCQHVQTAGYPIDNRGQHHQPPQTRDVPHAHVPPTIVVHGGIVPSKHPLTPDLDALVRRSLKKSLETGYSILLNGGTAVHAVEAAVRTLENNKLFSAGRGAPISSTGHPLLDATICDGRKQRAASAACASTIPNPNRARRAQLITEHRVGEYKAWQANRLGTPKYSPARVPVQAAGRRGNSSALGWWRAGKSRHLPELRRGKVAAASSSGGAIGRREGQISECGCIGASAWADSQVAISGVSTHDLCICQQTAHTIALRARYRQRTLESAAVAEGAFVAIDNMGKFSMVFSADSMVRGFCSVTSNHEPVVAIGAGERISSSDIHLA